MSSEQKNSPALNNKMLKKILIGVGVVVALIIVGNILSVFVAKKLFSSGINVLTDGAVNIENLGKDGASINIKGDDGEDIKISTTTDKDGKVTIVSEGESGSNITISEEDGFGNMVMVGEDGEKNFIKNGTDVPEDFPRDRIPLYGLEEVSAGRSMKMGGMINQLVVYSSKATPEKFADYYEKNLSQRNRENIEVTNQTILNGTTITANSKDNENETLSITIMVDEKKNLSQVSISYTLEDK